MDRACESIYFLTDGITDRLDHNVLIDASNFAATVRSLEQLSVDGTKKDDSSGICIQYHGGIATDTPQG